MFRTIPPSVSEQLSEITHAPLLLEQVYPVWQIPQLPPHPLLPHCFPAQFGVHIQAPLKLQVYPVAHEPQSKVDPQPLSHNPHCFPNSEQSLGVQVATHIPLVQSSPELQVPQLPPHPSLPHCFPAQSETHMGIQFPSLQV